MLIIILILININNDTMTNYNLLLLFVIVLLFCLPVIVRYSNNKGFTVGKLSVAYFYFQVPPLTRVLFFDPPLFTPHGTFQSFRRSPRHFFYMGVSSQ